ncbi:hypothetical protein [Mordavella massiliensis]|nr:hypothetical protein [Mordavella massiliensis]
MKKAEKKRSTQAFSAPQERAVHRLGGGPEMRLRKVASEPDG